MGESVRVYLFVGMAASPLIIGVPRNPSTPPAKLYRLGEDNARRIIRAHPLRTLDDRRNYDILWVPELCDADVLAVNRTYARVHGEEVTSKPASRWSTVPDTAVTIIVDFMKDTDKIYALCGMKRIVAEGCTIVEFRTQVHAFTHRRDTSLASGKRLGAMMPTSSTGHIHGVNKILCRLSSLRQSLSSAERAFSRAAGLKRPPPPPPPPLAEHNTDARSGFSEDEAEAEAEEEAVIDEYAEEADSLFVDLEASVDSRLGGASLLSASSSSSWSAEEEISDLWIYMHTSRPELLDDETCCVSSVSDEFRNRIAKRLAIMISMDSGNESAIRSLHYGNLYTRREVMAEDRMVIHYLAMALCHREDWSEFLIRSEARIARMLFARHADRPAKMRHLLTLNGVEVMADFDVCSSFGYPDKVHRQCEDTLRETIAFWRRAVRADLENRTTGLITDGVEVDDYLFHFLQDTWDYMGDEYVEFEDGEEEAD